jgi:hypothetical protein
MSLVPVVPAGPHRGVGVLRPPFVLKFCPAVRTVAEAARSIRSSPAVVKVIGRHVICTDEGHRAPLSPTKVVPVMRCTKVFAGHVAVCTFPRPWS